MLRRKKRIIKKSKAKVFQGAKSRYIVFTAKTLLIFLVLLILAIGCVWILKGPFFQIKEVNCRKDNFPCSQELVALINEVKDQNIFLFNSKLFLPKIKQNFPKFQQIIFKKHLPDKLEIEVIPRRPFAILQNDSGKRVLVDEEGFAFANLQTDMLPLIKAHSLPAIGELVSEPGVIQGLKLVKLLQDSYLNFEYVDYPSETNLTVILSDELKAIFSLQKSFAPQVDSLQYILRHSRMEDKSIEIIDLQFEKPVLKLIE